MKTKPNSTGQIATAIWPVFYNAQRAQIIDFFH